MTQIPLADVNRQRVNVVVFGARVTLIVYWQPISQSWYADIDINNEPAVRGRRITLDSRVTEFANNEDLVGHIYCRSLNDEDEEPGRNSWGITHQLVHEFV